LEARHLPVDEAMIVGDSFGERNGYIATKLLLKAAGEFTAILAFSNLIALGVIRALSEEGQGIPERVSLIAFDDQPYSAYLAAPMTTVSQSSTEMGQIAIKLLFDRIHWPERALSGGILLPTNLVVRGSVRNLNQRDTQKEPRHVCA
jgi:DNA-binding LacI/PurR family transcriptional regulator